MSKRDKTIDEQGDPKALSDANTTKSRKKAEIGLLNSSGPASQDADIPDEESLRRMITFTKREAERKERTFCAYLLEMALSALDEDTEEMNSALKARFSPASLDPSARKPEQLD